MSGKKIIKTREPGPEFQALASDWKPQVRRAWLVKPPPTTELEVAPGTKSVLAHGTESAATTEVEAAPSTNSVLAHSTESAATTEVEAAPSTESVLAHSTESAATTELEAARSTKSVLANGTESAATTELEVAPSTKSALADSTELAATTELEAAPSTESVLAHGTQSAATTELEVAPATKSVLGVSLVDPSRTTGWTKVPNDLLEKLMHLDLNQRGFRVMLLIVRQTLGFHRADVELSGTDIENATGIFKSHVPTVVRDLVAHGYLEKTSGGGREKNSYKIGAALLSKHQVSARTSHQLGGGTNHKLGGTTESDSQNEIRVVHATLLDPKKQKESFERNSLSNAPLEWLRYSDTLTVKARERANAIFEDLKQRFPEDNPGEIAAAPENLRIHGAPDGTPWSEIKSPHGLMESAWPQLRDFFRRKREAQQQAEAAIQARSREREALERRAAADDATLNERSSVARAAFVAEFSNEAAQVGVLKQFCPQWISNPLAEPGRSLAIEAWHQATQTKRETES